MIIIEVFIGNKPLMSYVFKILSLKDSEIVLKSRGRNNSKTIDVFEVYRRLATQKIEDIEIITNSIEHDNRYVSELIIKFRIK